MKSKYIYYIMYSFISLNMFAMDLKHRATTAHFSKKEPTLRTLQEINETVAFLEPNPNHPCRESWLDRCLKAHPVALKAALTRPDALTHTELQTAVSYITANPTYPDRTQWLLRCTNAKTILNHRDNEIKFKTLLASELIKTDPTRWQEIHSLLSSVGAYLTLESQLRDELFEHVCVIEDADSKTIKEQEITHATWIAILENYKKRNQPASTTTPHFEPEIEYTQELGESAAKIVKEEEDFAKTKPKMSKVITQKSTTEKSSTTKKKNQKKTAGPKKQPRKTKQELEAQRKKTLTHDLCQALTSQNTQEVKTLVSKHLREIDVDMRLEMLGGRTPLQFAVISRNVPLCTTLLDLGAQPNKTCQLALESQLIEKISTLGLAVVEGSTEIAKLLLKKGADPNQLVHETNLASGNQEHILCLAATALRSHNPKYTPEIEHQMVRLLLLAGAKAPCKQLLLLDLEHKKSWPLRLSNKTTASMQAILTHTSAIKCIEDTIILLADSSNLSTQLKNENLDLQKLTNAYIQTLLSKAIDDQDETMATLLVSKVEDPHEFTTSTEDGISMLHRCAIEHNAGLCDLLLKHNADPNAAITLQIEEDADHITPLEVTPLMLAIVHSAPEVVEVLLTHSANPNLYTVQKSGEGEYPLCAAVEACQSNYNEKLTESKKVIAVLLRAGATHFAGTCVLNNSTMKTIHELDLLEKDDQDLVLSLLAIHIETNTLNTLLECKNNVLIFNVSANITLGEDNAESN